jgi:hypothetical protein
VDGSIIPGDAHSQEVPNMRLKISLPYDSWKLCRLDTRVFKHEDIREIGTVAERTHVLGWHWCKSHVSGDKTPDWWDKVREIVEAEFDFTKFYDPELIMHGHEGTLELLRVGNHRMIALGVKAINQPNMRIPIDVQLEC